MITVAEASERSLRMYGTTEKKITHVIWEGVVNNGLDGYWATRCGKLIRPVALTEDVPPGTRICKQCEKKGEEDNT